MQYESEEQQSRKILRYRCKISSTRALKATVQKFVKSKASSIKIPERTNSKITKFGEEHTQIDLFSNKSNILIITLNHLKRH